MHQRQQLVLFCATTAMTFVFCVCCVVLSRSSSTDQEANIGKKQPVCWVVQETGGFDYPGTKTQVPPATNQGSWNFPKAKPFTKLRLPNANLPKLSLPKRSVPKPALRNSFATKEAARTPGPIAAVPAQANTAPPIENKSTSNFGLPRSSPTTPSAAFDYPTNQSAFNNSSTVVPTEPGPQVSYAEALAHLQSLREAIDNPEAVKALGLTPSDIELIKSLPETCLTDQPGLDPNMANQQASSANAWPVGGWPSQSPPPTAQQSPVQQSNFEQPTQHPGFDERVRQVSAGFAWPSIPEKSFKESVTNSQNDPLGNNLYPDKSMDRIAMLDPLPNPHAKSSAAAAKTTSTNGDEAKAADGTDPHAEIYSRSAFPSATECAKCHKQIYEEWASSSHAYASISPMFHKFENTINRLAQGTLGYFCLRCHAPVATTMGLRRDQAIWDGPRVFREGVTCVACHRVNIPFTKADGERRMEPGDIYAPVYGSGDGRGVEIASKYSEFFKTKLNRHDKGPGQPLHNRAIQFEELSKSTFCMSCHQVAVKPGIKLEVVWDQYRASPAYRDGISCQDCHMGKIPGVDSGYFVGPGAVVNDKVINAEKKHSNHIFYGPGYSIAHPGVFPDTMEADRWSVNDWLEFDWRAGWGTDQFEDAVADGKIQMEFPAAWAEVDDRYDAREIVDANLKKLEYKRDLRRQLLENGSKLDGPFFNCDPQVGQPLRFRYCVTNTNPGHNMPSGSLGAQPQLWVNAVLIGPNGQRVWESGHLDSNGDLCDNHSLDVLARRIPLDNQLMNFQTKFLTTNVKGTDREMYLPVNFDFDQLPFLRPAPQPVTVQNHPPFIRMEGHSLPPLGSRTVKYAVPANLIQVPGTYRLSVRMRSRAEPIYFMRFCDATPEMERSMNEWICDFHTSTVTFEVR